MRVNLILLFVVVALGFGLSLLLVPGERDLALLQLRSNNFEAAREGLDKRVAAGDTSVAVIASLAEIALHDGRIGDAVSALERYVADHPRDVGAKRRLAEYYQFDQRRSDYVRMLEEVVRIDGRPEEWRRLVDLHRARGEYGGLRAALEGMIERGLARETDFMEAAEITAPDAPGDALAILERLWRAYPATFEPRSVRLYVLVAGSIGEFDRAEAEVRRLAEAAGSPDAIAPIVREAGDRGQHRLGLHLLSSFEDELHLTPPLLVAWARMQQALDHEAVALARLTTLERQGLLPDAGVTVLLDLALLAEDFELVEAVLAPRDIAALPESQVVGIADAAVARRRTALLGQIKRQLPAPLRATHPALLAEVMLGLGRVDDARHAAATAEAMDLPADRMLRLARAQFGLGADDKAMATLERIADRPYLQPAILRALASLYIATERTRPGLAVFAALRREQPSEAAEAGWARLAAREGREAELLAWLDGDGRPSRDLLADIVQLAAPRLAPKAALRAAERLYRDKPDAEARRLYAQALTANGRAAEALEVIAAALPGETEDAEIHVEALVAADRRGEALAFLKARGQGGALPLLLADDLMALAIELGQPKPAFAEARRQDLALLADDTVASLAKNAAEAGEFAFLDWLIGAVGPAFLDARPVTAARIALARGDLAEAERRADIATARPGLTLADSLELARIDVRLGRQGAALRRLEALAGDEATPGFAMADLAALYLELGRAKEGLPLFRSLLARRHEIQVQEGWARLEVKAGEPERVYDWLQRADGQTRQLLTDVYHLAEERGALSTGFAAAERLQTRYPGEAAALIWGRALTAAGRAEEAVAVLRPLLPGGPEVRAAYIAALGSGGSVEELRRFARRVLDEPASEEGLLFALIDAGAGDLALPRLRELAAAEPEKWEAAYLEALRQADADRERAAVVAARLDRRPPPAIRDALIYELIDAGGPAAALPYLARAAEQEPLGPWPAAYEEALTQLGHRETLVGWLAQRAGDPGLGAETRRQAAFRLLDLGARGPAEAAFLGLAADAGAASPDVQQLLFLWGPRPPAHGLDWLEARARAARGADQAAWLGYLNGAGATARTVAIVAPVPPAKVVDPVLRPYVEALLAERRVEIAGDILEPLVGVTDTTPELLQLADWAEQAARSDIAAKAWEKLLTAIGNDPGKLLQAGRTFAFAGRSTRAVEVLERYFQVADAAGRQDHRPWYYHALALSAERREAEARAAYRRMLERIAANDVRDFESRRMQAAALDALGADDEAVALYESLLAEQPADRSLVADLAALLIDMEDFDRAEALLAER